MQERGGQVKQRGSESPPVSSDRSGVLRDKGEGWQTQDCQWRVSRIGEGQERSRQVQPQEVTCPSTPHTLSPFHNSKSCHSHHHPHCTDETRRHREGNPLPEATQLTRAEPRFSVRRAGSRVLTLTPAWCSSGH